MNPRPLIIDTDAGHDDALAMMLLIKSGQFDLKAVTTVCGNSTLGNVTRNAKAILELVNADNVPLYSGAAKPLARELVTAVVHGESGLDGLDMSNTKYDLTNDAPERIVELVRAQPAQVTILAIGPLTNIARCLEIEPRFASLVKELVIMGGAIAVAGNKNRVAEFNMFVDPEAADIVFKSPIKKILIPLDVCNDIVLNLNTFDQLAGGTLHTPLMSMMRHFIAGIAMDEGVQGALVYDALAAYYLLEPSACKLEDMDIMVETRGEHSAGMTIAERRTGKTGRLNVVVVTHIDQPAFVRDLLSTLKR